MNRIINVYADVEAFYDYRRGLLQCLMTKDIKDPDERRYKADKLWEMHIADNYRKRRMDTFNYPEFDIDKEKFAEIYKQRGVEHWATGMYYPTPLIKNLLAKVIDLEGLDDKPLDIKEVRLYVNTFPYDFGQELTDLLIEQIRIGMKGMVTVSAVHSDHSQMDARSYGQYQYVFRYGFMLDTDSTVFMESITANPTPDTFYIIPDIISRDTDVFAGDVKEWMFGALVPLSPVGKFIPIERQLFDYA